MIAALAVGALAAHGQSSTPVAQSRRLVKTDAVTYLFPEQVSVAGG